MLAFLIRVPDLRWGLPQPEGETLPVAKAFAMWGWDAGRFAPDPQTAGWPAFSFFVNHLLQRMEYLLGRLSGRYHEPLDFFVDHVDVATLLVPARLVNLLVGVAVVVIGVRLARRLAGPAPAALAGLVLAGSPLLVAYSLNVAPDGWVTLFSALALVACVDVVETGRRGDYARAGLWIGLGAASKYTPVLLVPALLTAHLLRTWPAARARSLLDGRLPLAGAIAAVVFFAATPFTVLDLAVARRDVTAQVLRLAGEGHFGHELSRNGFVYYLADALPAALGWPALLLGVGGLALAAVRQRGPWIVVLVAFAAFYLGLGALRSPFPHYLLPGVLPLALGVAACASFVTVRTPPPLARGAALALAALVVVPVALLAFRQHVRYAHPTTNNEARAFILRELNGPDVTFATEIGGPELPRGADAELAGRGVFERLNLEQRARLLQRPAVHRYVINLYMTAPEGANLYYDIRHFVDYDYVVVSGKARERYEALADRFPRQVRFYDDLSRYCTLVRHVAAAPDRLGPDIWIYRVGPATRRVVTERGGLTDGFETPFLEHARPDDVEAFLGFTGGAAIAREDWRRADLYLGTLARISPGSRDAVLLPLAKVKYRAGDLNGAAELCAEILRKRPDDAEAFALGRAVVAELEGGARR